MCARLRTHVANRVQAQIRIQRATQRANSPFSTPICIQRAIRIQRASIQRATDGVARVRRECRECLSAAFIA